MKTGPKKPISAEAARMRMADLCARSEQCSWGILEKLRKLGLGMGESRKIVDELTARKFIDDSRYAGSYSRDKLRFSGWGPLKIRAGLYAKRISSAVIDEALGELNDDEVYDVAMKCGQAKSRSLNLALREDCVKLMRHLASRGFSSGVCSRVLHNIRLEQSDSI